MSSPKISLLVFPLIAAACTAADLPGSFHAYDAADRSEIRLGGDLEIQTQVEPAARYVRVNFTLINHRPGERGILLDYVVPLPAGQSVFANELNDTTRLNASSTDEEGDLYPLATIEAADGSRGIALAIPPDSPCIFGAVGGAKGLTLRFYLGLSPETRNFPNQARGSFIIYPVGPGWAFRRALADYYSFFPEYYEPRMKRYGYLMFGTPTGARPDMDFYVLNRVGAKGGDLDAELARDRKYGLVSVSYINPGTEELDHLPKMPKSLDEAWQVYQDQCGSTAEEWTQGGPDPSICELIDSSACGRADGKYVMAVRYTGWGQNSISFKTNPNPALFGGTRRNVGEYTLAKIHELQAEHPLLGGVAIDSLGANWPATLNYRKDHFAYAKYPLTVDPSGRPAIHNQISYCEFLDVLRADLRARGQILYGNGIYSYPSRPNPEPEHYIARGAVLGRFFMAARLDIGSSEAGTRANEDRFEFIRVAMGRKLYDLTNAGWEDVATTTNWFNRCLLYGFFGENTRIYNSDPAKIKPYLPDGYKRDRATITWFVTNVRRLCEAGWEPVTFATASGDGVRIERYGSGSTFYLAVMTDSERPQDCMVRLDLPALGLTAGRFQVEEIAQNARVKIANEASIGLKLSPWRTCVLKISQNRP